MSNLINMEIYGVPIITYGLVGVTTAILAYATAVSGVSEKITESTSSETTSLPNPVEMLSNMNPISSFMPESVSEPASNSSSSEPVVQGGKKHRKTPRHKKSKKHGKSFKGHRK
jgi:hypothetical protein